MREPIHPKASPSNDPVDQLIADCLAQLSLDGTDAVDEVCLAHPQYADELRRRREGLAAMGLWSARQRQPITAVGPFELLHELGRGGMGVVYLAHQVHPLRRLAAVKIVGSHAATSKRSIARFEQEQQTLASLVHPNIAHVLEAGVTDDGQPWYAMEFVDGSALTRFCDERRLAIENRLELFLQLCAAVQFAHQRGVLHRDLKPGNILVCERDGQPLIKVIDFGLAKALEADFAQAADLTEQGQVLGTPEYMSPEQALPTAQGVDTRTDVYALGSVLYELCTGVLPFDFTELRKRGFSALQDAVCHREAPPPSSRIRLLGARAAQVAHDQATTTSTLLRRLTGDLDCITQKALQKDREQRYASVSELAADVRRHLRNEPVQAEAPTALYQLRKFVRRHRAGVLFATMFLVGLVVTLAVVANLLVQRNNSLSRFDTLQLALDADRLVRLVDGAFWPALPVQLPAYDEWLREANGIVDRLPEVRSLLASLESEAERSEQSWHFAVPRDAALHAQLGPLIEKVAALAAPAGPIETVAARRAWAADLTRASITARASEWQEAIATIRDPSSCPAYAGMVIEPQLGFVPLGRDEQSQLYEFAYLQPDQELPERGDGRWLITADTCMVFVLIPGGEGSLGVTWPDPRLPAGFVPLDTEYLPPDDGQPGGREFRVRFDPFLLSKYEMSQAQWQRLMGNNPSTWSPERQSAYGVTLTHPVGAVSARMADEAVRRLGLQLPTSAQWQYAARAHSEAPWWTGFSIEGWHGKENLADESTFHATKGRLQQGECDRSHDDLFALTAPVDSLGSSPFGLHHVLGNAFEWSRDPAHKYADAMPRDGDGAMTSDSGGQLDFDQRDLLGGGCLSSWLYARSTSRQAQPATDSSRSCGLRPARALSRQP